MKAIGVIVIDDEDSVRISLGNFLEDKGFSVSYAKNAEEALSHMERNSFQVAVVDMRLTGVDGNVFIEKAHLVDPQMRYIIYTGSTDYRIPQNLMNLGIGEKNMFFKPLLDLNIISNAIKELADRQ